MVKATFRTVFGDERTSRCEAVYRRPKNGEGPKRKLRAFVVPYGRIELPTSALPRMRSTTELIRPEGAKARPRAGAIAKLFRMAKRKIAPLAIIRVFS